MALPSTHFLVVDRDRFKLHHYRRRPLRSRWRKVATYDIAVGAIGYVTPRGLFEITTKARYPDWRMPDSDWVAPEDRGKLIKGGGPGNPLKEAFLSLWSGQQGVVEEGVGIHGTGTLDSLGTAASHGCIRVHPEVAVKLFYAIPVGTPVYVI
jgi:lipoprotein-anchoring transpeptidase ErfK/SrfK